MLKDNENSINYPIIINLLLLLLPYCGDIGVLVFKSFGKYYYAAVFLFTTVFLMSKYWINKISIKQITNVYKEFIIFAILNMLYFLVLIIASNLEISEVIMMAMTLIYIGVMSYGGINDKTLETLGKYATIMWLVQFVCDLWPQNYYNPNTYAFILSLLMGLSLFYVVSIKSRVLRIGLASILTIITIVIVEVIFGSNTETFGLLLIYGLFIIRELNIKVGIIRWVYVVLSFGMIMLPTISLLLINDGILDLGILTSRGQRWFDTMKAIYEAGIFHSTTYIFGAHNGFLGTALSYTIPGALLFLISLYRVMNKSIANIINDKYSYIGVTVLCYYTLINFTENMYLALNFAGFTALIFAVVLGRVKRTKDCKRENRRYLNE